MVRKKIYKKKNYEPVISLQNITHDKTLKVCEI